jgi:hypothetical protein
VAREEHEKIGDDIPLTARRPDARVAEGEETVDGVRIEHKLLVGAETEDALVIGLPDAGAIIVQDLIDNRSHLFLGERRFDGWRAALDIVLPGHSLPGDKTLHDAMIEYLDFAEDALATSAGALEFKQRMLRRYPNFGCLKVLEHQLRFLFP